MTLADRVPDLRSWAQARIEECRRQEFKFARSWSLRRGPPQALIEAWTERRTLQAVLAQLDAPPLHCKEGV